MKKMLLAFAIVLGFASTSQAGVLFDPYLGFEYGNTKNADGNLDGTVLGARLAYELPVFFWFGVDYAMSVSQTYKPDQFANSDAKRSSLYAVAGVDFPILFRAWLGYGLMNEIKFDNGKVDGGDAMKIGVGFTGLPFISLNLEMINEKFKEQGGSRFENNSYMFSVSLPL